jgi:hypothetical protein
VNRDVHLFLCPKKSCSALEGVGFCFAQVLGIGRVRNNIDLADQRSKTGEKNVRNNIILADPQISPDIRAKQHMIQMTRLVKKKNKNN